MWIVPTHEEEPWEHDRRRLGDVRAQAVWDARRERLGLGSSRTSPWPRPVTILAVLTTVAVLIVSDLWLRAEEEPVGGSETTYLQVGTGPKQPVRKP
jgi:hypothetical protein